MQRETRRAFNQYMYKTIHNPYVYGKRKMFYKYIKSLRSDHTGIPSLERNGQSYTTSQEKARILNEYFCTVFTPNRNDEDLPSIGDSPFSSISKINLQALGLTLDSKLTFNKHIECICKRANSALAFTLLEGS